MTLAPLIPFESAVKSLQQKKVFPTGLGSADLQSLGAQFHRNHFTSARTLLTDLLDGYKQKVESILNPVTEQRADRITPENPFGNVTTGLNPAQARTEIKALLRSLGDAPDEDVRGTLQDLSSDARINLVLKTNVETAQGAGRFLQMNDSAVVDMFPAQELYRLEGREKVRDWEARWLAAASESGDTDAARVLAESGRMIALKASPIWDSLGNGAGGETDALGNPYPPFAFNSGMWVQSVSRRDAEALGLITAGQKAEPHPLDLAELLSPVQ